MRRTLTFVLVAALVAQATVAPAAAQSDDGPLGGMFDAAADSEGLNALEAIRDGLLGRATDAWAGVTSEKTASDYATALQAEFNNNSAEYQSWANNHTTADTSLDVLEVTVTQDGESETLYLTADVVDGAYRNASIVATTDREPDESCELEGNAARNAADELSEFRERFIAGGENVTNGYLTSMGSRYGGNVDCSFSTEGL